MRVDHIALYTNNIGRLKDYYVSYFNGHANDLYHNKKTGLKTYFISFEGGARLEIMNRPDVSERQHVTNQSGYTHIAFAVPHDSAVDALTARMEKEGVRVIGAPRRTGDGYYESIVLDPDGNHVEIVSEKHGL